MSKKKRRRQRSEREVRDNTNNFLNNAPFGINPNQLMSLLGGNIDFNQIGNMLSSMNNDGLDLNNFNLNKNIQNEQINRNEFDIKSIQGIMNNLGIPNLNNMNTFNSKIDEESEEDDINELEIDSDEEEEEFLEEDENIQMLIAIKSIVDNKKANFIDRIIEEYSKGTFK